MIDLNTEVHKAFEIIQNGGIILYPTDTVWGIGCDATNAEAVAKIYALKKRAETQSRICLMNGEKMMYNVFKDIPEVTENSFLDAYTKPGKEYNILSYDDDYSVVNAGKSEGEITGGNLSLIVASLGTEYEINTDGKILFIEEIGEHTYRVDRMLQQLRLAGKLKNIKGIIIGDFNKVNKEAIEDMSLDDVFKENFKDLDIPIIEGVNSGHVRPFITIPIGANATIDTSKNEIIVKNIVK